DHYFLDQRAVANVDHIQRCHPGVAAITVRDECGPSTSGQACHFRSCVGITQIIENVRRVCCGRCADFPQCLGRITCRGVEQLQRVESPAPRPCSTQCQGLPCTAELRIEYGDLTIDQKLVADTVD